MAAGTYPGQLRTHHQHPRPSGALANFDPLVPG